VISEVSSCAICIDPLIVNEAFASGNTVNFKSIRCLSRAMGITWASDHATRSLDQLGVVFLASEMRKPSGAGL
jgi:hypothetical protein